MQSDRRQSLQSCPPSQEEEIETEGPWSSSSSTRWLGRINTRVLTVVVVVVINNGRESPRGNRRRLRVGATETVELGQSESEELAEEEATAGDEGFSQCKTAKVLYLIWRIEEAEEEEESKNRGEKKEVEENKLLN